MSTTTVTTTETTVLIQLSDTGVQGASGIGYTGVTSNSTITLGTGLKTFTLVSGYAGAFITGMRIRAIHSDTPTYYMEGTANYVGGGSIILTVDKFNGTGSHNLWQFAVSGETGVTSLIASSPLTGGTVTSTGTIGLNQALLSLTNSQISDFSSGTVTSASTAQQSGTATYATTSGTAVSISGSITKSQVSDFTSGTVASAGTAQQSGTATYATTSGTAVYSTTSGTAVSISGSITKSQVSDFASGTVANISGTVTQAQVSGLATTLSGYAALGSANTFTTGQAINAVSDADIPLQLRRFSATQTSNLTEWETSLGTALATVDASGFGNFARVSAGSATNLGYGMLSVLPSSSTTKGLVVRGATSQSANIAEFQSSAGSVLTRVASDGVVRATRYDTNNFYALVGEEASGGYLTLTKATGALSSPSAGNARIYFRDGTTGGTLKLVVKAGATGAETTILDNIPT